MNIHITPMKFEDWDKVREIYTQGIDSGTATFEETVPNWEEWDHNHLKHPRLVARNQSEVVGWAALSPVSIRPIYQGVAEVSIYVHRGAQGMGVGKSLLMVLIQASEDSGIWSLQAGIFPENQASITLHTTCGFRQVGRRERIGNFKGTWKDLLLYERRSTSVGI